MSFPKPFSPFNNPILNSPYVDDQDTLFVPNPPGTAERITEEGDAREIEENEDIRITE